MDLHDSADMDAVVRELEGAVFEVILPVRKQAKWWTQLTPSITSIHFNYSEKQPHLEGRVSCRNSAKAS